MVLERCLAPAKLNLFLHVVGRRPDGYHLLQTLFDMVDWGDLLSFERRSDGQIIRRSGASSVPAEQDLVVRAARLLQAHTRCQYGADIWLEKNLPMGAGLGGGSSDAATTLLALNHIWQLGLPRQQLQALALRLGADVPFFVFGQRAYAQGVGEELLAVGGDALHYNIMVPPVEVATAAIFTAEELTRDTPPLRIAVFPATQHRNAADLEAAKPAISRIEMMQCWRQWKNDLQAVTAARYPEVAATLDVLSARWPDGATRMSGSGSACFAQVDEASASTIGGSGSEQGPTDRFAKSLLVHPLHSLTE